MLSRKIVVLKCKNGNINYNYHYELMKRLYELMTEADSKLSFKIHNEGFYADNKKFKLFNYALQFKNVIYGKDNISVNQESIINLVLSGKNEILNLIIKGLIKLQHIVLNDFKLDFITIEDDKQIKFKNIMLYKVRTPVVESIFDSETKKVKYITPYQPEFYKALGQNLLRKYKALYNKDYTGELFFDIEDILKPKKKFITEIKEKGFLIGYTDFEIFVQADKDMQKVAYFLGLGQNTSIGMGNVTHITGRRI